MYCTVLTVMRYGTVLNWSVETYSGVRVEAVM